METAPPFSFSMSYCGLPPLPDELLARWNLDPVLLLTLFLFAVLGARLLRGAGRARQLAFAGAMVTAVLLFVSPLCALTVALFSARITHHALLAMVVSPLLALALPPALAKRFRLGPALVVSTIALWIWHAPDFYVAAFSHPALYWLMQLSIVVSFTWLWLGLFHNRSAFSAGIAALLSATQMGLLGALLVFATTPLYLPHFATSVAFGLTPLQDQQLGGLIMWVPANLPLLALVLWRLLASLGGDARAPSR